jgi:hypothetical protein
VTTFEFWPDYGPGPLWNEGKAVDMLSLGLPQQLAQELKAWNDLYAEDKLPLEGSGDAQWLREGRSLLQRTRTALGPSAAVVVTEPWWDQDST